MASYIDRRRLGLHRDVGSREWRCVLHLNMACVSFFENASFFVNIHTILTLMFVYD
jgi:hypothetical protein